MAFLVRFLAAIAITALGCQGAVHAQEFGLEIDHYVVESTPERVAAVKKRPLDASELRKRLREWKGNAEHIAASAPVQVGKRFEFHEAKKGRELLVKGEIIRVRDSCYLDLNVIIRTTDSERRLGPTLEFKPDLDQLLGTLESTRVVDGVEKTELHLFLARVSPVP